MLPQTVQIGRSIMPSMIENTVSALGSSIVISSRDGAGVCAKKTAATLRMMPS
jgi:hypothetical protein